MHGRWFCSAISCARRCFLTVSGKYEPPFTVASLATTTHSWPSTMPMPVTIPAAGAWPSYRSHAARAESSRRAESGSTSRSIRSRAVSLPRERWRSVARSPPPCATCAVRSRSSATSASIRSRRRAYSSDPCSTCEESTATTLSLSRRLGVRDWREMRTNSAIPPLQNSLDAGRLQTDDPEAIAGLREILRGLGYTAEAIRTALATEGPFVRDPVEFPFYPRVLAGDEPLSTVIKLFRLGIPVEAEEAAAALAPLELERLEKIGLLARDGGSVVSTVSIAPSGEVVLAADWEQEDEAPHRQDQVLGMSAPTRVLANLTVRQHVGSGLDIGTGCGVQAL